MEEKNNNNGLIILVCILSVLILALGGFIIYDKVLSKKELPVDNKSGEIKNNNDKKEFVLGDTITITKLKNVKVGDFEPIDFSNWYYLDQIEEYIILLSQKQNGINLIDEDYGVDYKESFKNSGINFGKDGYIERPTYDYLKKYFDCDINTMKCGKNTNFINYEIPTSTLKNGRNIILKKDGTLELEPEDAMVDSMNFIIKILKYNIN